MIHDDYLRFLLRGERAEPVFYPVNVVVVPFSAHSFFFSWSSVLLPCLSFISPLVE